MNYASEHVAKTGVGGGGLKSAEGTQKFRLWAVSASGG
jgi:hypothetical protein